MSETLTTIADFEPLFDELWLALGPKERGDYVDKMAVYHKAVRDIRPVSLRAGVERCVQHSRIRALPAPGELRARALEHHVEMQGALHGARDDRPPVAHTHCPCRCGGRRWYRVLRDRDTNAIRYFPADIAAQATLPEQLTAPRGYRVALERLAGEPMLRTHLHCRRVAGQSVDAEPLHGYVALHEDGCPIFDPGRREGARQEAA